ncbi:MAG TPA: superoxide dismutase [Opitutaceae bacterium]|nr:superoxide dismutase [Opitutaceae bacterium]
MKPAPVLTRREVLKTLGAGATLLGLGSLASHALAAGPSVKAPAGAPLLQPFTLPPLAYAYDALEPYIDARTMELHHTKHHQAYIDNANRALAEFPECQKKSAEELLQDLGAVPEKIRLAVRNHVGGHANHALFWRNLGPHGGQAPAGRLAAAIDLTFGSFDACKTRLTDMAMKRFGSGWAWLSVKPDGVLVAHSTANQDSPLSEGLTPVLGLDVWEHAYYLQYQNRRADYVDAIWNVVAWRQVEANFTAATKA